MYARSRGVSCEDICIHFANTARGNEGEGLGDNSFIHTHIHICTHGRRCRSYKYVVKWASFLHFGARSVKTTTTSAFDVFDNIASERVLNARTVHGRRRRWAGAHRVSTIYGLGDDYDDDDIYRN